MNPTNVIKTSKNLRNIVTYGKITIPRDVNYVSDIITNIVEVNAVDKKVSVRNSKSTIDSTTFCMRAN